MNTTKDTIHDLLFKENGFSNLIKKDKEKIIAELHKFIEGMKKEVETSKETYKIMVKYVNEGSGSISENDEKIVKTEVYDLIKIAGIGIPFILIPGASIILPILIGIANKKGVNLLPSAFNN